MGIPSCKTLKDLLGEYISLYWKENWSVSTYRSNVALINNYILPLAGKVKLEEINTRFIENFYQKLLDTPAVVNSAIGKSRSEHVITGVIRDIHKLLRSCFNQAVKWDMMMKKPSGRTGLLSM